MRNIKHSFVPHEDNDFRPYLLRAGGIALFVALIVGTALGSGAYRLTLRGSDYLASVLPAVLIDLANTDRTLNTLGALTVNPTLIAAAQLKANDMAAKGYFAHQSPDGKSPWYWFTQAGYEYRYAGENLAINFDDSAMVNTAWMNSPGHRANLLNNHFTEIGIATAQGFYEGQPTTFVVQLFGSRALAAEAETTGTASTPGATQNGSETAPSALNSVVAGESVVPIVSDAVTDGDGKQIFVAVRNANIAPSEEEGVLPTPPQREVSANPSSFAAVSERTLSSPSSLLYVIYIGIGIVLLVLALATLRVKHPHRIKHGGALLVLALLLIALYLLFSTPTLSSLQIL